MSGFILALDQGTTSSRAIVFNRNAELIGIGQHEFTQHYPQPGWVEHDLEEIWKTQLQSIKDALSAAGIQGHEISAIGITNQRETTAVWNRKTGEPVHRAIVWQDRRTADTCTVLRADGKEALFQEKTGLLLDPYFSGTKIKWILDHVEGARRLSSAGDLAFGTIDTWLIWKLTQGERHVTDVTNASRTLLYPLNGSAWDASLLEVLDVPSSILPEVISCREIVGECSIDPIKGVPIAGIAGDQQAALFGQACYQPGMVKNTYGTGCFMLMHTGEEAKPSKNRLLTTIAGKRGEKMQYAVEGSVFTGGAVVQWLRDGLGIIKTSGDVEALASEVDDNGGVYLTPAFTGLGAPHWDAHARGTITGLTRGSKAAHIARAALESIAFQSADLVHAMEADTGIALTELRVDGGATACNLLMQFQADILDIPVVRPQVTETTALGAAFLAGLAIGYWKHQEEIEQTWREDRRFEPEMTSEVRGQLLRNWQEAVERSKDWAS